MQEGLATKGLGLTKIVSDMNNKPIPEVPLLSRTTIYKRLRTEAGKAKVIPAKFLLTDTHRKKRRQWAREMKSADFNDWLFSDETLFTVGARKHRAFQFPGEKLENVRFSQPVRQNVWACMSSTGMGAMEFIDGTLTGKKYKQILENNLHKAAAKLFPDRDWVFQQDKDPETGD